MKTKVQFIIYSLGNGGAEKVLIDMLENLDRAKFSLSLTVIKKGGFFAERIPGDVRTQFIFKDDEYLDIKSGTLRKLYKVYRKIGAAVLLMFPKLFNLISNKGADIVVSFDHHASVILNGALAGQNVKKAYWVHTDIEKIQGQKNNWLFKHLVKEDRQRKIFEKADMIACVSSNARKVFLKVFPTVKEENVRVLYNPVIKDVLLKKAEEYFPQEIRRDMINIVCCGRLVGEKGQRKLINALSRLVKEGFKAKLILVGSGTMEEELRKISRDMAVEDNVAFAGYKANPYPYIKNCDICASASEYEGYCLAVAEAMALSKPIVSTDTEGASELLNYGEYGIITGHGDEELYSGLRKLVENEKLRKDLCTKLGSGCFKGNTIRDIEDSFTRLHSK